MFRFPRPMTFEKLEFSLEQSKQKNNKEKRKPPQASFVTCTFTATGVATAGRFIGGDH